MMKDELNRLAPNLCTSCTKDANLQAESLVNWQQEYDQLSNGGFLFYEIHLTGDYARK